MMDKRLERQIADSLRKSLDRDLERAMLGTYTTTVVPKDPTPPLTLETLCSSILSGWTGKAWRVHKYIPATSVFDDGTEREVVWRFAAGVLPEVTEETYTCNTEIGAKLVRMMRFPKEWVKDAGT